MKTKIYLLSLLLTTIAVRCEEFVNPLTVLHEWVEYTVYPEGTSLSNSFFTCNGHSAKPMYITQTKTPFEFEFYFKDSSYVYDIGKDQSDWNKLYGLVDYWNNIHDYSFRFSWRYFNDELQIGYYVHLGDDTIKGELYTADIGEIIRGAIDIQEGRVTFKLESEFYDTERTIWDKRIHPINKGYVCPFYFGGNCTAPHPLRVMIKCEQLVTALDN